MHSNPLPPASAPAARPRNKPSVAAHFPSPDCSSLSPKAKSTQPALPPKPKTPKAEPLPSRFSPSPGTPGEGRVRALLWKLEVACWMSNVQFSSSPVAPLAPQQQYQSQHNHHHRRDSKGHLQHHP